jgi:hypothetical protein
VRGTRRAAQPTRRARGRPGRRAAPDSGRACQRNGGSLVQHSARRARASHRATQRERSVSGAAERRQTRHSSEDTRS